MSKTIPHHLCTRQTIIEKGEALSAAIKKYPNKALQTVLILIKTLFGYVPEVIQVFLKEDVVLRCHNDIDPKRMCLRKGRSLLQKNANVPNARGESNAD